MQHTIQLLLGKDGNPVPRDADGKQIGTNHVVNQLDEIRWMSPDGEIYIEFQNGSPFINETKINDTNSRVVAVDLGKFAYQCTIVTADGKKHGWAGKDAGGTVEVSGGKTGEE